MREENTKYEGWRKSETLRAIEIKSGNVHSLTLNLGGGPPTSRISGPNNEGRDCDNPFFKIIDSWLKIAAISGELTYRLRWMILLMFNKYKLYAYLLIM